ncbi:MAG: hypothetical protein RMJ37_07190, partial [Spirochaetia bacterium]|nr:hypothetical protein [Spirochaetota bacterium]MDW8113099.1 hypothetical protein [Spirochaetia bacterium]
WLGVRDKEVGRSLVVISVLGFVMFGEDGGKIFLFLVFLQHLQRGIYRNHKYSQALHTFFELPLQRLKNYINII